MTLSEQLQGDMKDAMRSGDTLTRDTLRMCMSAMKNARIDAGRDLDAAGELAVIAKAVKSREDSATQYTDAGRDELAAKERAEIEVIRRYLPEQLDEAATRAAVEQAIADTGASAKADLGQVMKAVMAAHRGSVDGKTVSRIAGELLS